MMLSLEDTKMDEHAPIFRGAHVFTRPRWFADIRRESLGLRGKVTRAILAGKLHRLSRVEIDKLVWSWRERRATTRRSGMRTAAAQSTDAFPNRIARMHALKDNLVGSWRLVKYEELPVDSSPTTLPLGDEPDGYIIYSADGYFAAILSSTDDRAKADPIAYAGPYSVDEEQQVVHQQADISLVPRWAGKTHSRKAQLEGDRLILSTLSPANLSGRTANAVITWQRVDARISATS